MLFNIALLVILVVSTAILIWQSVQQVMVVEAPEGRTGAPQHTDSNAAVSEWRRHFLERAEQAPQDEWKQAA